MTCYAQRLLVVVLDPWRLALPSQSIESNKASRRKPGSDFICCVLDNLNISKQFAGKVVIEYFRENFISAFQ